MLPGRLLLRVVGPCVSDPTDVVLESFNRQELPTTRAYTQHTLRSFVITQTE